VLTPFLFNNAHGGHGSARAGATSQNRGAKTHRQRRQRIANKSPTNRQKIANTIASSHQHIARLIASANMYEPKNSQRIASASPATK
jgi:hypothetical protein